MDEGVWVVDEESGRAIEGKEGKWRVCYEKTRPCLASWLQFGKSRLSPAACMTTRPRAQTNARHGRDYKQTCESRLMV